MGRSGLGRDTVSDKQSPVNVSTITNDNNTSYGETGKFDRIEGHQINNNLSYGEKSGLGRDT